MAKIRIAPSILASDFSRLRDQIKLAEEGGADWIHLDVMDGHFVPNLTFGPLVVRAVRQCTKLHLDTHLMIEHPERLIESFRDAGADTITVHQEACVHLNRVIAQVKESGANAGVALNPSTPLSTIEEVISDLDLLLIMSVNPGFGGQKFIKSTVRKLKEAKSLIKKTRKSIHLEVDGGIDPRTTREVVAAGANVLVVGTSVFRQPNIPKAINALRKSAEIGR